MFFKNEIKDFIKNTLILTLFFTLVLHLSWGYIAPMLGFSTNASTNDKKFVQSNITYLGNIATAMSINVGQKNKILLNTPVSLPSEIISIAEVLSNPDEGQRRLIGGNMSAITNYSNLLKTDIVKMLDGSTDRSVALDDFISLLKSYGTKTNDRLLILDEQISDLNAIVTKSAADTATAKSDMQASYVGLDYTNVDSAIAKYTEAKEADIRARVYLVYLENFKKIYLSLQSKNRSLLEALSSNREALIKRTIITIPNAGSDILKELNLLQTEAEAKAKTSIEE